MTAHGDVVASGEIYVGIPSDQYGVVINLVTGETGSLPSPVAGWDFAFYGDFNLECDGAYADPENAFVELFQGANGVNNLPLGTIVGPGKNVWTRSERPSQGEVAANWVPLSGDNYVGIRFKNEATGDVHYGWMRFCVDNLFGGQPRSIVEYAYESTPNTAIAVGAGGTGQPADCVGTQCLDADVCDNIPTSNSIDCLTLLATDTCHDMTVYFDRDWRDANNLPLRHTTWQGPAGAPVDVALFGYDAINDQPAVRELAFQSLTLRDVNMEPDLVKFRLIGDQTSLTLDNAFLRCSPFAPVWDDLVPLSLTASGGTSTLIQLSGLIGPVTSLSVPSGATLQFDSCGQTGFGIPDEERCYFTNPASHADIDGGTLRLLRSHVIFGADAGELQLRNGGRIVIEEGAAALEAEFLHAENSTIALGAGSTRLDVGQLDLVNSSATISPSANIEAGLVTVEGDCVVSIDTSPSTATGLAGAVALRGTDAHLTINDDGEATVGELFMDATFSPNPRLTLDDTADLTVGGGILDEGTIEILNRGSTLTVAEGATVFSVIPIVNQGRIAVEGLFEASGTISGSGQLEVVFGDAQLRIEGATDHRLEVEGRLYFSPFTTYRVRIDPQANRSQRLVGGALVQFDKTIGPFLNVALEPADDAVLPVGTKFGILDYSSVDAFQGKFFRSDRSGDLEEGDRITVGLNTYELAYYDPEFDPANPTMITLTVVCRPDLDGDGTVDSSDLGILLAAWGVGSSPADLDGNGRVDGADLGLLTAAFGPCS